MESQAYARPPGHSQSRTTCRDPDPQSIAQAQDLDKHTGHAAFALTQSHTEPADGSQEGLCLGASLGHGKGEKCPPLSLLPLSGRGSCPSDLLGAS